MKITHLFVHRGEAHRFKHSRTKTLKSRSIEKWKVAQEKDDRRKSDRDCHRETESAEADFLKIVMGTTKLV